MNSKIEELKNRILITLGLLIVYRFGAHVTLPGIDASHLSNLAGQTEKGIGSILDMFTGGAFSKASVWIFIAFLLIQELPCSE